MGSIVIFALLWTSIVLLDGSRWLYFELALIFLLLCLGLLRYGDSLKTIYRIILHKFKSRLGKTTTEDPIYPIKTPSQSSEIKNAVRISFTGDLILLRDGVERAYNQRESSHDFTHMFEYVSDIWKSSDLSIGVFEGPMGGAERGWSTSNYDDGIQ